MLTLALDTSRALGTVGLGEGERLLAETVIGVRATHSETVLPEVERLFELADRDRAELEAVVVGEGPGSFTGLRIGAALAKGICFGTGRRLHAFSSLSAVAAGTGAEGSLCVLFQAREDEVYAAGYRAGEPWDADFGPEVAAVDAVLERVGGAGSWTFAGDGAVRHRAVIEEAGGRVLPVHLGVPRASALLWLLGARPEESRVDAPEGWEPRYVRASGAERGV